MLYIYNKTIHTNIYIKRERKRQTGSVTKPTATISVTNEGAEGNEEERWWVAYEGRGGEWVG